MSSNDYADMAARVYVRYLSSTGKLEKVGHLIYKALYTLRKRSGSTQLKTLWDTARILKKHVEQIRTILITVQNKTNRLSFLASLLMELWKMEEDLTDLKKQWHGLTIWHNGTGDMEHSNIQQPAEEALILYHKGIKILSDFILQNEQHGEHLLKYSGVKWRKFQRDIIDLTVPDNRKVHWIVDIEGNSGKTYLSKYLVCKHNVVRFENGRNKDIRYAYNYEPIVVFDFSRSVEERVNYEIIESIKNGIFFSSKYECGMKIFNALHVVIFANFHPDQSKLSQDRWNIIEINEENKQFVETNEESTQLVTFMEEGHIEFSKGRLLADISQVVSLIASFTCPQCFRNRTLKETRGFAVQLAVECIECNETVKT